MSSAPSPRACRAAQSASWSPSASRCCSETTVVGIDERSIETERRDGSRERVAARTKIWAAGVAASPLARLLAEAAGAETDRAGRIVVEPDLTVPGHPEVFAFGDMTVVRGSDLHGVAPVAMQQGRHVAHSIRSGTRTPFHYNDKGELATIGRARAVGVVKGIPITRLPGVGDVARDPHRLPRRLPEPGARPDPVGIRLRDARTRSPHHSPLSATAAIRAASA